MCSRAHAARDCSWSAPAAGRDALPVPGKPEGIVVNLPVSRRVDFDWSTMLADCMEAWRQEEAAGPHLVVLSGADPRYFGPFPDSATAQRVAETEAEVWRREFPEAQVSFHVAPLGDPEQFSAP